MTRLGETFDSPLLVTFSSSTQLRARSSQGSRPSASHWTGVVPFHQTVESGHQSTVARDCATDRPSRTISRNRASGKASASKGILRLFATRLLTKNDPPEYLWMALNAFLSSSTALAGTSAG